MNGKRQFLPAFREVVSYRSVDHTEVLLGKEQLRARAHALARPPKIANGALTDIYAVDLLSILSQPGNSSGIDRASKLSV